MNRVALASSALACCFASSGCSSGRAILSVTSGRIESTTAYSGLSVEVGQLEQELKARLQTLIVLRLRERGWFARVKEGGEESLVLSVTLGDWTKGTLGQTPIALSTEFKLALVLIDRRSGRELGTGTVSAWGLTEDRALQEAAVRTADFVAESR